jgi:hypothetical protein
MKGLGIWCVVIVALFLVYSSSNTKSTSNAVPEASQHVDASSGTSSDTPSDAPTRRSTFDGYDCSVDCGGHAAGYRWAEEHDIDDEDDCDTAGANSNSPSFAEGCKAFVNGEPDDDSDDSSN